jgi:hypothetical protein
MQLVLKWNIIHINPPSMKDLWHYKSPTSDGIWVHLFVMCGYRYSPYPSGTDLTREMSWFSWLTGSMLCCGTGKILQCTLCCHALSIAESITFYCYVKCYSVVSLCGDTWFWQCAMQNMNGPLHSVTLLHLGCMYNCDSFISIHLSFHHHHHNVHEGLGVFPVPWSSKWNWSLHLFLGHPMFLCPFGLYCNACFGILFVSILCMCCGHLSFLNLLAPELNV